MDAGRIAVLEFLLEKLGIELDEAGLALVDVALTHPTYAFQHGLPAHNQRLEFLGDAVLNLIIAERLYREFPAMSEGELTRVRAAAVCEASLADVAKALGLEELLLLGYGEERSGGRQRGSNLADALEAVAGALYLTGGLSAAQKLADVVFDAALRKGFSLPDSKTRLQELVQQQGPKNVTYRVLAEWGPDHDKRFRAGVYYKGRLLGVGEGRSKKEAEQEAARAALQRLDCGGFSLE